MATMALRFGHLVEGQGRARVRWVFKRNCSLSPRWLLVCYASLCTVSLGIAAGFWRMGATLVMPFAWVELLGVGVAMLVYARHATDQERLALCDGCLRVALVNGHRVERAVFQAQWVRVEAAADGALVRLVGQGREVRVGRHVRPELRGELARELRMFLGPQGVRAGAGAGDCPQTE